MTLYFSAVEANKGPCQYSRKCGNKHWNTCMRISAKWSQLGIYKEIGRWESVLEIIVWSRVWLCAYLSTANLTYYWTYQPNIVLCTFMTVCSWTSCGCGDSQILKNLSHGLLRLIQLPNADSSLFLTRCWGPQVINSCFSFESCFC